MEEHTVWHDFDEQDWHNFASDWLAELDLGDNTSEHQVGQWVVSMNFNAPPDLQWHFLLTAVRLAATDSHFGHIAAGPLEHLLGWHGDEYIDLVERQAHSDPKFERMLTGLWRYRMSDDVWTRVQALHERARNNGNRIDE